MGRQCEGSRREGGKPATLERDVVPRRMSELTAEQQTKILQSHMFIGQKWTGETKARIVTGGNTQRGQVTKEELSSPTMSTKAVLLTSIVNARKGRDAAVVDIPNTFIQS